MFPATALLRLADEGQTAPQLNGGMIKPFIVQATIANIMTVGKTNMHAFRTRPALPLRPGVVANDYKQI